MNIYIKLLLTTFFWGGTFVAARYAVSEVPPFYAATCRFTVASVLLFALMAWQAGRKGVPVPKPTCLRDILALCALGLTGIFCYNAFFFTGLKFTGAANGSLIAAINPLMTAVIAAMMLREQIRPMQLCGLLLSLLGVFVIVTRGDLAVLRSLSFNQGDLLILGAPLSWSTYSVLGKRVLSRFSPLTAVTYATISGTIMLLPAALIEAQFQPVSHSLSFYGWLAIMQLALLGTVVGFVWWYEAVGEIGASRAALFVNLVPLFGTLQAALILGERLGLPQLLGGLLVISGVCWGTLTPINNPAGSMGKVVR